MADIDLNRLTVILATDWGSPTTNAIMIDKIYGHYGQTYRG